MGVKTIFQTTLTTVVGVLILLVPYNDSRAAWPEQPIELVCATSAKSGAAHWCRLMSTIVSKELGQRVDVLFKGGGGGNTAAEYVANKPADGYTWLHRNTSYAGYMNLPTFKPDPNQFEVVVHMTKFLYVIGVRSDSKYKTFKDLIADMKANPGKISVAANKPGSAHHRHLINLFRAYDVKWNYVPYKGSGRAMKDVLGGHVPVGIVPTGIWMPQVKAGKGRSLVLLNETPYPGIDAPIPKDFGQDYQFTHQVQGFFLKKGTPDDVKKKIADAFKKASESQAYQDYIKNTVGAINVFSIDGPALTKEFHDARMETGAFLKEAGLIK
ncbi:Bug family tripartite tricarboxylate transporter substrate binding protein [Pseudomonadota bacterium]